MMFHGQIMCESGVNKNRNFNYEMSSNQKVEMDDVIMT